MKKIILLATALILALSCSLSCFAWSDIEVCDFSRSYDGAMVNASTIGSDAFAFRNDWTPSRNATNDSNHAEPDETWNYNSIVVTEEDDWGDEFLAAQLTGPQYIVSQYDSHFVNGDCMAFEMKKDVINGFAGVVLNYGTSDILNVGTANTNANDYFYTEFPAKSDSVAKYVMATGYGFTFLPESNTAVRLFVRCFNEGELDVIYYDVETGIDLTVNYCTFCFYYTSDKTYFAIGPALDNELFYGIQTGETESLFPDDGEIGDRIAAVINFSNKGKVSEKIDGQALTQEYCRTASICDDKGNVVASSEAALVYSGANNDAVIAVSGAESSAYLKTIIHTASLEVPTKNISDPTEEPATPKPTPEATEEPVATEVPTEAPTEAPTAAPTKAPEKAEEKGSDSSTGLVIGIVAAVVVAAAIVAVIFIKKKKK